MPTNTPIAALGLSCPSSLAYARSRSVQATEGKRAGGAKASFTRKRVSDSVGG